MGSGHRGGYFSKEIGRGRECTGGVKAEAEAASEVEAALAVLAAADSVAIDSVAATSL